jgi:hypothetical protein
MLTDTAVRQARPKQKEYKLSDERGLLLVVRPNGCKWWRLRYRFQGPEKMISLGVYPDVSLSMARERRDAARRLLADGKDPSAERQAEKKALTLANEATFERIAQHYLATLARKVRRGKGSIKTYKKAKWMLETFIFPKLGDTPIAQITASDLLVELKKIEAKGLNETARRTKQRCGKVFRHAIGLGHAVRDLTPDLRGLLEAPQVEHHAALTDPRQIGELLLDIDNYDGRFITRCEAFAPGRRRSTWRLQRRRIPRRTPSDDASARRQARRAAGQGALEEAESGGVGRDGWLRHVAPAEAPERTSYRRNEQVRRERPRSPPSHRRPDE